HLDNFSPGTRPTMSAPSRALGRETRGKLLREGSYGDCKPCHRTCHFLGGFEIHNEPLSVPACGLCGGWRPGFPSPLDLAQGAGNGPNHFDCCTLSTGAF